MPVLDLSTIAEDFNENPYPHYARLRADGPVHRVNAADGQHVQRGPTRQPGRTRRRGRA